MCPRRFISPIATVVNIEWKCVTINIYPDSDWSIEKCIFPSTN